MAKELGKAPAFQFYYDRFNSSTALWSNEQVGMYLRLLMAQANAGYVTEKQLRTVVYDGDQEVISKFREYEPGKFRNDVLSGILADRDAYRESRAANRLGKKRNTSKTYEKHMNNICASPDVHMVDVVVDVDNRSNKGKGGAGGKGINAADLIPADWDRQAFLDNWADFEKIRKAKKKHLTDIAVKRLVGSLVRFSEGEWYKAKAIMEKTIVGAWDAFYELKPGDLDVVEAEKQEEWGVWVNGKKVS